MKDGVIYGLIEKNIIKNISVSITYPSGLVSCTQEKLVIFVFNINVNCFNGRKIDDWHKKWNNYFIIDNKNKSLTEVNFYNFVDFFAQTDCYFYSFFQI